MTYLTNLHTSFALALVASLALVVGACDDDGGSTLGPDGPGSTTSFSRDIGFEDFQARLNQETVRVEIEIISGGLIAREVELEGSIERSDEEAVESPVTGITAGADEATLTMALGGLQIVFDRASRLEDEEGSLTFDEFVARIEAALAAGRQPFIEAKRPPPAEPQAPDVTTFFATRIELEDEDEDDLELEINIDADNLIQNDSPPPNGWIAALGLMIELRVDEGITELEEENIDADEEQDELEGLVETADLNARTFTLIGSDVLIRIVDGTDIEDDGDEKTLATLGAVQSALEAGLRVEAEVETIVETADPPVLIATEVEFEVEDNDGVGGDD